MNSNGASRGVHAPSAAAAVAIATCPTCDSPIPKEKYDRILSISEARQKQFTEDQMEIQRERAKLAAERTTIASNAVAKEREKRQAETERAALHIERLQKKAEEQRASMARGHEKQMHLELQKREAQQKRLDREITAAQAKAKAEAAAGLLEAKRAVEGQQRAVVDELRAQLRTLQQRRRRDEEVMKQTVADLQRKAEARDRAHFGPEGEEDLLSALREEFPDDTVEHRGRGGDVLQTVLDGTKVVGPIIYEVKNTKSWQQKYLRQTKQAMETHGTRYGVLVTRALPAGTTGMCVIDGVIVAVPALAKHVVIVLREGMLAISRLRTSEEGKSAKTEALFNFLRGDEFRVAIQRVQEKVRDLRESLAREKSHHDGWWTSRETHYSAILRAATGIDARVADLLSGQGDREPAARAVIVKTLDTE